MVLAAGGLSPGALPDATRAVRDLHRTMHVRRVGRLRQLGFAPGERLHRAWASAVELGFAPGER